MLVVLLPLSLRSEETRPSVRIAWSEEAPQIDGQLSDPVWQDAALIDTFLQVTPVPGGKPSQRTDVRILTDGEFIYFGIRCHDTNPEDIVANVMLRDARLWYNDRIVIGLDTFHDRRNGYAFEVNPRGSRHDVLIEGDAFNSDWTTLWFAEASIDSGGWSLEVAIPFHSVNFDPDSDVWGFNISRGIRRNDEQIRWSDTQPQRFVSDFAVAGTLEGMLGIRQGVGISVIPSATLSRVDERNQAPPDNSVDPSLDVFYNFYPSVVASATVNSGFAETEVDDRHVNLDRFDLFFPEKRAFFLQDALIFSFADFEAERSYKNGLPFDSRKIGLVEDANGDVAGVDILAGGKVTGRLDRFNFGFMDVVLDDHDGIGKQNVAVGRVAMNVLEESTLGAIVTHGNPTGGPGNSLVGMDFNYANSDFNDGQTLMGQAWFAKSFTEGVETGEWSYGGLLEYPNDKTSWKIGAVGIEKNYNPALGFVNRTGIRRYNAAYRNRIRRNAYVRTIDSKTIGYVVTDLDNNVKSGQFNLSPLTVKTEVGDAISVAYRHDYEHLDASFTVYPGIDVPSGSYPVNRGYIRIDTSRNRVLQGAVQVTAGGFYGGTRTSFAPEISWRPNFHWLFEVDYILNDVSLPQGDFKTHLLRARVNVQFTPNLAWITVAQWDNVTDSAGINTRVHWIIEDGRELFVVFNQGLETEDGVTATTSEPLIKVEWAFRF